jgi:hypothetical protein
MRTLSRRQTIDALRSTLLSMVDEDHSICEVAARNGFFCRGFEHYSDDELRTQFRWLAEKKHPEGREALIELANRWVLARQNAAGAKLACDLETYERDTCFGWDEFSNATLERFHRELLGETVRVMDGSVAPEPPPDVVQIGH